MGVHSDTIQARHFHPTNAMSSALIKSADCCVPCESPEVVNVPGPKGDAGTNGTNGSNGKDSYTTITANFTVPAVSGTAVATVVSSLWAVVGQTVWLAGGGDFVVTAKTDGIHVTLQNTGYPNNFAPGTVVASGQALGPSGQRGQTGASGATITLNDISPTTTRGDLIVDNGAGGGSASDVRFGTGGAGSNGKVLAADASQASGLSWNTVLPDSATDNAIVRFDGTTGKPVPGQDSKVIITDDGAVQASGSGGNARGSKAVDLQVQRAANTQVASGTSSVVAGGINNTASNTYAAVLGGNQNESSGVNSSITGGAGNTASGSKSFIGGGDGGIASGVQSAISGGQDNLASGDFTHVAGFANTASSSYDCVSGGRSNTSAGEYSNVAGGRSNTAGSDYAFVPGGQSNQATGTYSSAKGLLSKADYFGKHSQASGGFSSVVGSAQTSVLTLFGDTTDATPTELYLDGGLAGTFQMELPNNTTWAFRALFVARRTDTTGNNAAYQILGCITRNATAGSTSLIGSITKTVIAEDDASWDVDMAADASNGALGVYVTGAVGKTVRWVARVELTEVSN